MGLPKHLSQLGVGEHTTRDDQRVKSRAVLDEMYARMDEEMQEVGIEPPCRATIPVIDLEAD